MKSASAVRRSFLEFFEQREHRVVASSPVFPQDDPTLLFTNAGMNQFKDVFLGTGTRDYTRAADTQKCLRVSGKHNDLEEVGRDSYHHTFFEMLGNWSFGDYFKREAIRWAWEYLTGVCGLPKERLWATVFGGDVKLGLPPDEEAERLWREVTDIDPAHVLRFGIKDNFWEMGETGPCGPCSEIHFDRGGPDSDPADGADADVGVNAGNERFIEIWNLVFIQYNRLEDGSLSPLPDKHIDTGMSLERLTALIQGKTSNYDTDLFTPIIAATEKLSGKRYGGGDTDADVAFRVIADHLRALGVAIADGVLPGKTGRGYVLRRLLRRAARMGRQALGVNEPFLGRLVPALIEVLGDTFPEIADRRGHVERLLAAEEQAFGLTLDRGLALFEELSAHASAEGVIPGERAYDLYATYGFPRDLVELMARERDLTVDADSWDRAEAEHKDASKGEAGERRLPAASELEGLPPTEALYHADDGVEAEGLALRLIDGRFLVLDRTPFYAEAGGQVGDRGTVTAPGFEFRVDDTQRSGQLIVHIGELVAGEVGDLPVAVRATVDAGRRRDIMANHTATHLLHWALRETLGREATQQGSLVAPDRLRFDFTHERGLTLEELERIERMVNERIVEDFPLRTSVEKLEDAKRRGVTALFGEKYESRVRVVEIADFSAELCGGTHCASTGQIGSFVVVSEGAVQAGVRRIEALTRGASIEWLQRQRRLIRSAAELTRGPERDVPQRIQGLQEQLQRLKKELSRKGRSDVTETAASLLERAERVGEVRVVTAKLDGVTADEITRLCDALRSRGKAVVGLLGAEAEGKALLAAFATRDLVESKTVHAGNVVRQVASLIDGGGGGRPDFARAGGKKPAGLDAAVERGRALLVEMLSAH